VKFVAELFGLEMRRAIGTRDTFTVSVVVFKKAKQHGLPLAPNASCNAIPGGAFGEGAKPTSSTDSGFPTSAFREGDSHLHLRRVR